MATVMSVTVVQNVKGSVDGNDFDFARVYAIGKLQKSENANGYAGIEVRGEPHIYDEFLKYPFEKNGTEFNVEIEQIAVKGGEFKNMVTKMSPVNPLPSKK